jgi:hypothetical protein
VASPGRARRRHHHLHDQAGFTGWTRQPWREGTWTYEIPTHYKAEGGASTLFHTETQVMRITNAAGDATVSKYDSSA